MTERDGAHASGVSHLLAHAMMGISGFATWWVLSLVLIPIFDGNRLSVAHVVAAAVGAPIVAFLWWTSVRLVRSTALDRPELTRPPR